MLPMRDLAMNSADRARWLKPSVAMAVDGDAPRASSYRAPRLVDADTPDASDALTDVLVAMRDADRERREPIPVGAEDGRHEPA